MPGGEVGQAWWEADLKDEKLKAKLRELDQLLRQHGQQTETALNQGWNVALDNAGKNLQRVGGQIDKVGGSMTRNLTVPIVGLGAATSKMGLDFDTTLRQIVGLTDVTEGQIRGIREEILALGPAVGKGPQELAEAFYFVASAGFTADEAMDVLKTSATAAATGLGETQAVAQVLGSVINAYGKENITAARAADILVEAISQGTAEAPEFASVLGRVAPTAASLGVTFDQVASSLAGMTLTGLSAEESATSLNQVLVSLLKPTADAEEALNGMGLSSANLRKQLREEGLLATLRTLEERFAGNDEAAAAVFGNIRALRGVTSLLTLDSEQLNQVFEKVNDSTGRLAQGYEETEGPQREIDRAMADLSATAIELGEDVLPVVIDVLKQLAGGAQAFARWWRSLDDDTKRFIVQMAGVIAIGGPLLSLIGKLTSGVGSLFRAIAFVAGPRGFPALVRLAPSMGAAFHLMLGPIGLVTAALSALALAWTTDFMGIQRNTEIANGAIALHFGDLGDRANALADETGRSFDDIKRAVRDRMEETSETTEQALAHIENEFNGTLERVKREVPDRMSEAARDWTQAAQRGVDDTVDAMDELPPELQAAMTDAGIVLEDGSSAAFGEVSEEAAAARDASIQAMKDMVAGISNLFETDESIRDAWQALIDRMDDPYTEAERKADIFSKATITNIRNAIQSGDPDITGDTQKLVENMLGQIELMEPGALASGEAVPPAIRDGMDASMSQLIDWIEQTLIPEGLDSLTMEEADEVGLGNIWRYSQGMRRNAVVAAAEGRYVAGRAKVGLEEPDFYGSGQKMGFEWVAGLGSKAVIDAAFGNASAIAASVGGPLRGLSPPKYGPLKNIDRDAERVGMAWVGGWGRVIEPAFRAASTVADSVRQALTLPVMPAPAFAYASAEASQAAFSSSVASLAPPPVGSAGNEAAPAQTVIYERHVHLEAIQGYDMLRDEDDTTKAVQRGIWLEEGGWDVG